MDMNIRYGYIANIGQQYANSIQVTVELTSDYIKVARGAAGDNVMPLLENIGKLAGSIPFEQVFRNCRYLKENSFGREI